MSNVTALRDLSQEGVDALRILSSISEILNSSYDLDIVLNRALDVVIDTLGAQRGFLILEGPEVAAARGMGKDELQQADFQFSRTIVEQVLKTGEPVLSHDAAKDRRLKANRSLQMIGTRSILCVPMRTRSHNIGLVYLDSQISVGVFTETDLDLLRIIADFSAAAIERAKYFSQMVQSEKMAALGTMVAGIAHELNNPLTSIMGLSQLLAGDKGEDAAERREMAQIVRKESVRCRNLVRDLLGMTRQEKAPRQMASLGDIAECATRLVRPEFEVASVRLNVEIDHEVPKLDLNEDQWIRVILNLLHNARYAVKTKPHPRVDLQLRRCNGHVRMTVADNGDGIPHSSMRKIFDPFFTTKPAGEGTGLGLSLTHSIVVNHGGTISASNHADGGAMFVVELPYA